MENSNDEDAFHISQRGLVNIMLMEYQNVKAKSPKSINKLLMDFHKAFPCANSYPAYKVMKPTFATTLSFIKNLKRIMNRKKFNRNPTIRRVSCSLWV